MTTAADGSRGQCPHCAWRTAFCSIKEKKSHPQRMQARHACIFLQILGKGSKTPRDGGLWQSEGTRVTNQPRARLFFSEPQFSQLQKGLVWTLLWCGTLKVKVKRHIRAYCYCEELSRQLFLHLHYHLKKSQTTGFSFPMLSTVVHTSPLRAVI